MTDTDFNAALNAVHCRYQEARDKLEHAEQDAVELLEPRLKAAIDARDFKQAFYVTSLLPSDCVSRVFWMDRIRNARGDYNAAD